MSGASFQARRGAAHSDAGMAAIDRPVPSGVNAPAFGSDVAADALRATGIDYIALNPGASYRGFHDSLVNFSAMSSRRCCSACTRKAPSPSRTATPR